MKRVSGPLVSYMATHQRYATPRKQASEAID